jgi:hypothetical protein
MGMDKRPFLPYYSIESDVVDSTIKKSFCIVEGFVIDQSGNKIQGALISTVAKKRQSFTDSIGHYTLKLTYKDSSIFMFHKKYGEIVIQNYDFQSRHRVIIHFNPRDPSGSTQTVKKPVIYLYSNEPTNVSVVLNHPGMTFMYPIYEDGWHVRTSENGTLQDLTTGKDYPYLFWEATTTDLLYQKQSGEIQGYLINTDTVVSFLETSLTQLGLNDKEQTDFITFWAPQLIQKQYVLMQFLVDELYNQNIAQISVNPVPDNQRRIFMLYSPLNSPSECQVSIVPQELISFQRTGLTLVEWGGAEIQLQVTNSH